MSRYVILLRGINVGGRNKLPMSQLREHLTGQEFENVATYIQSGNIVVDTRLSAHEVKRSVQTVLSRHFKLDTALISTLVIAKDTYKKLIANAPEDFGEDTALYRYDVLFLIEYPIDKAVSEIELRSGVDAMWPGDGVVYFRRPSLTAPDATKSKLGKITAKPVYRSVTIRNWNTCQKLLELLNE